MFTISVNIMAIIIGSVFIIIFLSLLLTDSLTFNVTPPDTNDTTPTNVTVKNHSIPSTAAMSAGQPYNEFVIL